MRKVSASVMMQPVHAISTPRSNLPQPTAGLYAIVYVSTASHALSLGELRHLQQAAQQRNAREDLSGVLLYADGAFMQYLEGPAPSLSRVYQLIKLHPWHYGLIDLLREPIEAREFAGWTMAMQVLGAMGSASPAEQDAQLARRLAEPAQAHSAACTLLSRFWCRGRGALASTLLDLSRDRAQRMAAARRA